MSYGDGAKLIATRPGMPGQEYPLEGSTVQIGRDPSNDIVVHDPAVSRRHAQLELQVDDYLIRDMGATNGLFVNGKRVDGAQRLLPGDKIQLGSESFIFMPAIADAMETQVVRQISGVVSGALPAPKPRGGANWPALHADAALPLEAITDDTARRGASNMTPLVTVESLAMHSVPALEDARPDGAESTDQPETSPAAEGFWRRFGCWFTAASFGFRRGATHVPPRS